MPHHKNNTELTIAFTSDLHGEIAPLKHASDLQHNRRAEAARGQRRFLHRDGLLSARGPAGMGASCGRWAIACLVLVIMTWS